MSNSSRRHGRRTASTSARYTPSQLEPAESKRAPGAGAREIGASAAVGVVAIALVALIWMLTGRLIQDQGAEIRERAELSLAGQAATITETISHELQVIDQSLSILQAAWKRDSDTVDLIQWQKAMPALLGVSEDVFIADDNHIIRQDIIPQAVGQGVGAAYVTFPHGVLESFEHDGTKNKESVLLLGQGASPVEARQFLMYIVRLLDHPQGWLIGASYRSAELTKLFAEAALGFNPVVALADTQHGNVQAIVGPSARQPKTSLSQTPLYAAMMKLGTGIWLGPTGIDDVERLHAFRTVPGRDMAVVVGANWSEVMQPAKDLAIATRVVAATATALVIALGGLLLWEVYTTGSNRRRKRTFERVRGEIERLRADEALNVARARINATRLQSVIANASDGFALFDSGQRLVQWNFPFARGIGIELRQEMPLDALLREQIARPGRVSDGSDPEVEVARRAALLQTGDPTGVANRGPDGEALVLRGLPIEQGGFVLVLNGFQTWQPAPAPGQAPLSDEAVVPQPVAALPIDW